MKSCSSSRDIAKLQKDGWYLIAVDGSHHYFKHPTKIGKISVKHPCKIIPPKTINAIEIQSGVSL